MSMEIELVPFALGDGSGVMVCCADDAMAIIAQRDERIAELETQLCIDPADVCAMERELAALKAQKPIAGVALSDLIAELKKQAEEIAREGHAGWGNTMLSAAEALSVAGVVVPQHALDMLLQIELKHVYYDRKTMAEGIIAICDLFARLNPCRAQAVPGWADAVEACAKLCEERAAYYESGDDDAPGSRRGNACRNCADVIRYNLAAAPSAKKESE